MRMKSKSPTKLCDYLSIPRSQTLDLSHQTLTRVPPCRDTNIKKLCLNHNKLTDVVCIQSYINLRELDVSNNNIKSWKQLRKVSKSLQVLVVQANPLQAEPNYVYNIVLYFPNIKKINRLLVNQQLRANTIKCQQVISSKLIFWVMQLNRMDQRLIKTFCSSQLRIQTMQDYRQAVQVLQNQKKVLSSQLAPFIKFQNQSMFVKNRLLKDILQKQQILSYSNKQKQEVEQNYFQYLISLVTKLNKNIAQYLVSEITINDDKAEKQLIGNESLMFKSVLYHFKKHWVQQSSLNTHTVLSVLHEEHQNIFPYYPFEQAYVQSVYQSFVHILQSNIKKVDESLEHVTNSQPLHQTIQKKFNDTTKFIGDGFHRSTWISQNSLRPIRLSQIDKTSMLKSDYFDYLPLIQILFYILQNKFKQNFFNNLVKHSEVCQAVLKTSLFTKIEKKSNKTLFEAFNRILESNYTSQVIQEQFRCRTLKLTALKGLKQMVYLKYLKLQKLQDLIVKKQRATKLIKAYSFKRWKLMSSRTLKYIQKVRKSLDKKQQSIEERYRKIVTQRLGGGRSRAVTQLGQRRLQ